MPHNTSFDGQPAWSPNGKAITFTADRDGNGDIFTMTAAGKHQKQLTHTTVGEYSRD